MRRIGGVLGLWLCVCLCLALCGCRATEAPPETSAFSATVTLTAGDFTATATVRRAGIGQLQLDCTAPPSLAGFSVLQNGETVTLSKNGVSFAVSPDSMPQAALFLRLCRVLDDVALGNVNPQDGRVQGVCETTPYTLTFDEKTGELVALYLPNEEISVVFSDFSLNL